MNIIPISEAEIKGMIKGMMKGMIKGMMKGMISSLKPKISSGYEEITSKIIKSCTSLISIPLTISLIIHYT